MAMKTNTTRSMERASAVLAGKCERTQKNMDRLMAEAGCAGGGTVTVTVPLIPGNRDDVIFVGLNGVSFYFPRGRAVTMPEPVAEILRNAGEM